MQQYRILWADDEIDLLKPHILFLEKKGYQVVPVNSGSDALELVDSEGPFDIVFLDENMPGMSGLETLSQLKRTHGSLPVVMITKSEEEHIMEEAIGSQIADYLIKPLNPSQILLSVKKLLDNKRLVTERTNMSYQQEFRNIAMAFGEHLGHEDWAELYKKLVYWELAMDKAEDSGMSEVLDMQKTEANGNFAKFVQEDYVNWLKGEDGPLLSHQVLQKKVFPHLSGEHPVFLIVIDNLRYDQWKILQPQIEELFNVDEEDLYYSILPTTTAYARNALFSGMLPDDMARKHKDLWVGEDDEGGKNNSEAEFLGANLKKANLQVKYSYHKILNVQKGKNLVESLPNLMNNGLNAIVYNFVDMLSHARTDMEMIRELAPDESAYRSLTNSWFAHSPLLDALRYLSQTDAKVILTTDHGTIRVKRPFKIVGDRTVNTNLRYKQGKNLGYDDKDVFSAYKPEHFRLPKPNLSTSFAFAIEDYFFAYPNNYNQYVNLYRDTFQHGGVSLEEMIIPIISLTSKNG